MGVKKRRALMGDRSFVYPIDSGESCKVRASTCGERDCKTQNLWRKCMSLGLRVKDQTNLNLLFRVRSLNMLREIYGGRPSPRYFFPLSSKKRHRGTLEALKFHLTGCCKQNPTKPFHHCIKLHPGILSAGSSGTPRPICAYHCQKSRID